MDKLSSNNSIYDITIRMFMLIFIVGWCLMIMYPFVSIILWSLILALALYPLHQTLSKKMGGKTKLASFIIVFSLLAIVIIPSSILTAKLIDEVKEIKTSYTEGTLSFSTPAEKVKDWPIIGDKVYDLWYSSSIELENTIIKYKDQLYSIGSQLAKGILSSAGGVFQIMASLIIAGILLVYGGIGEAIRKFFRKLAGNRGDEFADITKMVVGNVVKGVLGVALIQAFFLGVGFILADIPFAGIWTLLAFIIAILQIPPTLIVIPISIYLFSEKEVLPASLWSIYLLIAAISDNVIKPILLGKGAPVPMLVIFIGVIGGFILSGFIGLFTGAIIMSLGYKLFLGWMNSNTETSQV